MSDFALIALGLLATVAPLGVVPLLRGETPERRLTVVIGAPLITLALLAVAALLADPLLDVLDVSGENYELAAGLLMAPLAFHLMVRGESMVPLEGEGSRWWWAAPLAFPGLASPASLGAAVAYSSRFGAGVTLGAEALACVAAVVVLWGAARLPALGLGIANRLLGAVVVLVAVELIVDAIRSV